MPRRLVRIGLMIALVASPLRAHAEEPSGSYAIDAPIQAGIGVPTELDEEACETDAGTTVCYSGALETDGSGAIGGEGLLTVSGEIEGELAAYFDGRLAGRSGEPKLTLSMILLGDLTSESLPLQIQATSRARCANDSAGRFECRGSIKLCAYYLGARVGCESSRIAYFVEAAGGPWQLRLLDLTTDSDGAVSGAAEVELSTGQVFSYGVTGKYDARKDSSSLRLAEIGTTRGSKLRLSSLVLSTGVATGGRIDHEIAGQRGRVILPVPAPATFVRSALCAGREFCDTAADTASFFSGPQSFDLIQDETMFFGIQAPSRFR